MPDDTERLMVSVEARIRDLEKNMQKAERIGTKTYNSLRSGSASATRNMEKDMLRSTTVMKQALATVSTRVGDFGKAFAVGAVGAGMAGFVAALKTSVESTAELSRQARMAGVDVEAFQELKFAAEQNKIGVDALTDGLKELNLRADEFVQTGAGSAAETFQRLGYTSDELAKKLKNPSELFIEIIGRMKQFDRAAQIRIGDEVFGGTAGERFVELVEKGEAGLREQIRLARDLGLVMNRDVVKQAEEVDRKFNIIATTIGTKVKGAIVEAVSAWMWFLDTFREFEQQQTNTLQIRQTQLGKERLDIEKQILDLQGKQRDGEEALSDTARNLGFEDSKNASLAGYTGQIDDLRQKLAALGEEDAKIANILSGRNGTASGGTTTPDTPPRDLSGDYMKNYRDELAKSNRERQVAAELEKILSDASGRGVKLTREQAAALAEETVQRQERDEASKKSASASEKATTATEKERERVKEIISELEKEIAVVWKSDEAKRALEGSRMAGADATAAERDRIIELNEALFQQQEAREKANEAIQFEKDLTRSALDDLKSALDDGKISWEEMGDIATDVLGRISDKLLDDVLDSIYQVNKAGSGMGGGGGFLSSLFGGLFGGNTGKNYFPPAPSAPMQTFAKGGVANRASIFAEAGPEAAVPLPDGRRIPVDLRTPTAQGSGGAMDVNVQVGVTVDQNGNLQAYVKDISRQTADERFAANTRNVERAKRDMYQNGGPVGGY